MFTQVSALLRHRAERLWNGQFDALAAQYIYPLPMYMGSSRLIVRNADEAASMLCLLRSAYLQRGVIALQPRVTALDLPREGRFRAWVDWHELAIPAEETRLSSVIYYCRMTASGVRTEMVNYTRLSMPELKPHFAALALSA
jgi:hypothetical protein